MTEEAVLSVLQQALGNEPVPGGATADRVAQAEADLGVSFPPSYSLFLAHFGAGSVGDFELAGLVDPPPEPGASPLWADVVRTTKQLHAAVGGHIPRHYVFISDDRMDCKLYLDTSAPDASGECPVVLLGPGYDDVVVAASFLEFVVRAATSARQGRDFLAEAASGRTRR